eukprot:CAMPEP_0197047126 /NCGR_PEP_ID=MMETSP1384-20130603/22678_1 /TAXON_ID=29189 /ORGANISM="Ammonia sp." /LENGTH=181 /DNA_ID=CAMNT_0042478999 /DNA_START=131 /DNA_END=676 /DNA_ORIENTATION=+
MNPNPVSMPNTNIHSKPNRNPPNSMMPPLNHVPTISMTGSFQNGSVYDSSVLRRGTRGVSVYDEMKLRHQHEEIQQWLVGLGYDQYFDAFVTNGYDSMEFVRAIESEEELQEIGIVDQGHVAQILAAIRQQTEVQRTTGKISFEIKEDQINTPGRRDTFDEENDSMDMDCIKTSVTIEGEQ